MTQLYWCIPGLGDVKMAVVGGQILSASCFFEDGTTRYWRCGTVRRLLARLGGLLSTIGLR